PPIPEPSLSMMLFPLRRVRGLVSAVAFAIPALALTASATMAQVLGSDVRGTVTDARTHTPIMGARVAIATPERVAITDQRGTYTLRDLPAGNYVIITSAIGRKAENRSVTVDGSKAATLDVSLSEGSLMLSSVVVSATRTQESASRVASTVSVLSPEQVR